MWCLVDMVSGGFECSVRASYLPVYIWPALGI
jgi:hypothetical protein